MPYISVIIPACNEENYIRKTLHSIKTQTFQDYEVIVVANGCTDKTKETVEKRANSKMKCLNMSIANVSRARNYGAGKAEGEILVFLDADTVVPPDFLQKVKQQFTDKYSVATTLVQPEIRNYKYSVAMNFKNFYNKFGFYKGCSSVLICRRQDFDRVEGYDPEVIVREHRKLILKLLSFGKYACLDSYAKTSMRRFESWGLGKSAYFWTKQWFKNWFGDIKGSDYEKIR